MDKKVLMGKMKNFHDLVKSTGFVEFLVEDTALSPQEHADYAVDTFKFIQKHQDSWIKVVVYATHLYEHEDRGGSHGLYLGEPDSHILFDELLEVKELSDA
jgi:hypothetical protein